MYLQITRFEITQSSCKRDTKSKSHVCMKLAPVRVFSCKHPLRSQIPYWRGSQKLTKIEAYKELVYRNVVLKTIFLRRLCLLCLLSVYNYPNVFGIMSVEIIHSFANNLMVCFWSFKDYVASLSIIAGRLKKGSPFKGDWNKINDVFCHTFYQLSLFL